jgi:glyoxylase-like metal-dependent hydrolase (beta-lactamase superfamily II)
MQWRIGDVTVTKIVELEVTGGSRFILPEATRDAILPIAWLRPHFADDEGRLRMSIHTFAVETPTRRIIVDTCLGNDKQNRRIPAWNNLQGPFLADLAAAGYPRESIDTVLCTHLHVDHVGWNTMLVGGKWVPTFPRARYLMGRVEFEH